MSNRNRLNLVSWFIEATIATVLVASLPGSTTSLQAHRPLPHQTRSLSHSQFIRAIKRRVPSFFTFEDLPAALRAKAVRRNHVNIITIPRGQSATLPNGDRILPDGSWLIKRSGRKFQPILHNGRFTGRYKVSQIKRSN